MGMEPPSRNSRPPDTVYHGTETCFDRFDLDCCLGAHFGTAKAAVDRLRGLGKLRVEYLPYRLPDGQWMVREQNWSNRPPFEHGPFEDEGAADCFVLCAPPHRVPLQYEIDVIRPLPLPDLGTWTFEIVIKHLCESDVLVDTENIWRAWNSSSEQGWASLKEALSRKGYDSVCYSNETEDPGSVSWIVFDPDRIHPKWKSEQADNESRYERERMRA